jgi:protein O-mannosyl-transferase
MTRTISKPSQWSRRDSIYAAFLLLVTILVYQPAWNGKPIWDDEEHMTKPELQSVTGLIRIWTEPGASQQYYPLTHTVFWIEHRLWGEKTIGYHLSNIFLHACSALLLLRILRRLEVPGAWLAAAIFALHPVQVESVAWISELKNTLAGVFYLGAALAYLRFAQDRKRAFYWLALGLFVLGLLSKTVIVSLPVALLLVLWWKRKRLDWKQDVIPLAPFLVIGFGFGMFTAWVERTFFTSLSSEFNFSVIERVLIAGRALCFYLGKIFWPADLTFIYPRWNISQAVWWQYLFPAAAMIALVVLWRQRERWRATFVGAVFFPITLFPALGFVDVYPFRFSFVADHFQYLATIGPIALVSAGIAATFDSFAKKTSALRPVCSAGLLLILGSLTWRQAAMYIDSETLWRTTIARNPSCWMAYNNLGIVFRQNGRVSEEIASYLKALELNPNSVEAHANLGLVLEQVGRLDEAIVHYQQALKINPAYTRIYNNLGIALDRSDRLDEAIACYEQVLKIRPDYAEAHNNLAVALQRNGRLEEAAGHCRKALEITPDYAEAHYNLGNILQQNRQLDEAISHYNEALKIRPDYPEARNNLDLVLEESGRTH